MGVFDPIMDCSAESLERTQSRFVQWILRCNAAACCASLRGKLVQGVKRFVPVGLVAIALTALGPSHLHAEGIPALAEVPAELPQDLRVALSQERGDLSAEYRAFKADSDAFNALKAEQQDDGAYAQLMRRRDAYIAKAKAFNAKVHQAIVERPYVNIGVAAAVRGECWYELADGTKVSLGSGQPIYHNVRVHTGPTGKLQLMLLDQTTFTIGPNSDMVLDEFVYDPNTSVGKVSASILKGVFRYVTGKIAQARPTSMKVTVPVGCLGDRGTDFEAQVAEDGSTTIRLFSGEVDFVPKKGGPDVVLKGRQQLVVGGSGAIGTVTALPDSAQPSL